MERGVEGGPGTEGGEGVRRREAVGERKRTGVEKGEGVGDSFERDGSSLLPQDKYSIYYCINF